LLSWPPPAPGDHVAANFKEHFDLVTNAGMTTEHVFYQANCFAVIHNLIKVGGIMARAVPSSDSKSSYVMKPRIIGKVPRFCLIEESRIMQQQFELAISIIVGAVILLGIYLLFSPPPFQRPSWETNQSGQSGQETPRGDPPPEPHFDLTSVPKFDAGARVKFGTDTSSRPFEANHALISGWSVPEPGGIWTLGQNSAIGFVVRCRPASCASDDALLVFDGSVYVVPGHPRQAITVWIGIRKVDEVSLSMQYAKFAVELKDIDVKDGTPIVLSLHLPDATVQRKANPNDLREIAFRISGLRLEL
jgi:hypothetical protein